MKVGNDWEITSEQHKSYWEGNIFFCDGLAWGVREVGKGDIRELRSVCLGKEEDIKKQNRGNAV